MHFHPHSNPYIYRQLNLPYAKARHLLLAIRCNAHRILNANNDAVGLGLFPLTSLINHDCKPNVTHYFVVEEGKAPLLVVRAIAAIAPGEELVYSYVPLYQSTKARREQLHDVYGFHCHCSRCEPLPLPPTPPSPSTPTTPTRICLLNDDSIIDVQSHFDASTQSQLAELGKLLSDNVSTPASFLALESESTASATSACFEEIDVIPSVVEAEKSAAMLSSLAKLEGFYTSRTIGFNPCHR
jgi:hypothetical protein